MTTSTATGHDVRALNGMRRIALTDSTEEPVYGMGDGDRLFVQVGKNWWFAGFLIAPVHVGERLRYVCDDQVLRSAPVTSVLEIDQPVG